MDNKELIKCKYKQKLAHVVIHRNDHKISVGSKHLQFWGEKAPGHKSRITITKCLRKNCKKTNNITYAHFLIFCA